MKLYTIGFAKKTAERFFSLLEANNIERLVDIRLNPRGQLAGFTKQDDLPYFLSRLIQCEYHYLNVLAPSDKILSNYRNDKNWNRYVLEFEKLMDERKIPYSLDRTLFEEKICCLLCSEPTPDKCHRRLVSERLARYWSKLEIVHIV
jgi:uncharacterized protein (DUF488 family)